MIRADAQETCISLCGQEEGGRLSILLSLHPCNCQSWGGAARTQLSAAVSYEAEQLADRNTARRCTEQGIQLFPIIAESFGGGGPRAQTAFNVIARASATRVGQSVGLATIHLYEGLSTIIMRANARSLLARLGRVEHGNASEVQERASRMV